MDRVSVFQKEEWKKFLPEKLHIVTNNGNFNLAKSEIIVMPDKLQLSYYQKTFNNPNDVLKDGEPDTLSFDIHMVKTNDGSEANPNTLKLDVDIAYGDAMVSEFTITKPGQIEVSQYTGFGSKYDNESEFGFDDNSIDDLVVFFNRFGFTLNKKDFSFIDKYPDSYKPHYESIKLTPSFDDRLILVINNSKPTENRFLPNIINYLKNRGIPHNVVSNKDELDKNNNEKVIGCISSGSEYRITKPESNEDLVSEHGLNTLSCPILGMCYGMQSMAKSNGSNLATLDNIYKNNSVLNEYDKAHPLFKGVDLNKTQVSFNFLDYPESCPQGFKEIARLDDKVVGIANEDKKHYGLLFHPEDIDDTQIILDNFVEMCKGGVSNNDLQKIDNSKNDMKYIQTFEKFRIERK